MSTALFSGLIFCCTGLEPQERDLLRRRIEALGGTFSCHLTRNVTHLIASRIIRSEKYKNAKELLKISVLQPRFVEECWNRSHLGSVDLNHLEQSFAIPALFGCIVSVTGICAEARAEVAEKVKRLGGTHCADLNKSCTHLLTTSEFVSGPRGPKLQFALKWSIPIVEIVYSDERQFLIHVDPSKQKTVDPAAYDDVTLEEVQIAKDVPHYLDGCHIYLGDGVDEKRFALLKRLILVAGGTRYSDYYYGDVTHFIVHNQTLSSKQIEQIKKYNHAPIVLHDQWLLACFVAKAKLNPGPYQIDPGFIQRAYSVLENPAATLSQATTLGSNSQPRASIWSTKRKDPVLARFGVENANPNQASSSPNNSPTNWIVPHKKKTQSQESGESCPSPSIVPQIFASLLIHLDDSLSNYRDRIVKRGGRVISDAGDLCDYYIYPLVCHRPTKGCLSSRLVNELWLLQCIGEGQLLSLDEQPFFGPIFCDKPVDKWDEFKNINICPTGFASLERDYYAHMITSLGGSFSESFSTKNTHLLCKSGTPPVGPKIEHAQKKKITCVTEQWLLDTVKAGVILPVETYKVVLLQNEPIEINDASRKRPKLSPTSILKPSAPKKEETPQKTMPSVQTLAVDTPLRTNFVSRIKQATEELLMKEAEACPLAGSTEAIVQESLATLMTGLVFAISQRLWHRRDELYDLVIGLGGTFLWTLDPSCTHYIHQGNQVEENFREFRVARKAGKQIVSPWWLFHSKAQGTRLPEESYPHTFNPNASMAVENPVATPQALIRRPSIGEKQAIPLEIPHDYESSLEEPSRGRKKVSILVQYGEFEGPEACGNPEDSIVPPTLMAADSAEGDGVANQVLERIFAVSALLPGKRASLPAAIQALGGTLVDAVDGWDPRITHLIIGSPSKSEKYLSACASGIWVLRPDYIEACEKAGNFLPEAEYEWQPLWTDTSAEGAIKAAARNWRTFLSTSKGKAAFDGWNVLLAVDQKRMPGLRRILQAGHATVFTIPEIYQFLGMEDPASQMVSKRNSAVESSSIPIDVPPAAQFTHVIISSHAMRHKIPSAWLDQVSPELIKSIEYIADYIFTPPRLPS